MSLLAEIKVREINSKEFRNHAESYYFSLVEDPEGYVNTVPANTADKYKGDFYGLLRETGIDSSFWVIILVANKLSSSMQYDGVKTDIYIPSNTIMEKIIRSFRTRAI